MSFWKRNKPALPDTLEHTTDEAGELSNPFVFSGNESNSAPLKDSSAHSDPELAAAGLTLKKRFSLPSLHRNHSTLLAFQAGSFGLRGALIQQQKGQAVISAVAHSRTVDFTRAIADVLAQLSATQKRLPKRAILLTPSVISAIVELPVSPLRPRGDEQMQELIHWELEGSITQQNKHWMIGSMLVERGYLTSEQREEVLVELEVRQTQGGPQSLTRFGDLSVQLGFINRDQLEECFALQGKLVAVDDDLVYGWKSAEAERSSLSDETLLSQEDDSNSSHAWLVSGMSKTVHQRWLGAFNLNHIHLEAFYPTLGSSFANLNVEHDNAQQWLFEIHQEQLALLSGTQKIITSFQAVGRQAGTLPSVDECLDLIGILPSDISRLYISGAKHNNLSSLLQPLSDALHIEIQHVSAPKPIAPLPLGLHEDLLHGVIGAASHFLQLLPASRVSPIGAKEHKEALWQKAIKPRNLAISATAVLVIGMFSFLGWMQWNTQVQTKRLSDLNAKFEKESKVKKQLQAIYNESLKTRDSMNNTTQETATLTQLLKRLEMDRSHRAANLPPLLKAITLGVTPDVALRSIEKKQDRLFIIAEVSSPTSGQEYVDALTRWVRPVHYQVANSSLPQSDNDDYLLNITLDFKPGLTKRLLGSLNQREQLLTEEGSHATAEE